MRAHQDLLLATAELNAAVSYGAFWVLYHWLDTPPADASGQSDTLHLLGLAAGAGFGGAALIRARLATIRLPSKRCCPSSIANWTRQLATERYHTVHELMVGIDFERAKRRLPRELFLAMQSVPEEEAAQVSRPIDEIDRMDDLSSQDKSYLLGYYLLDLVGKEFLAAVLEDPNRRAEYLLSEAAPD